MVCRLLILLYGLKQVLIQSNAKFDEIIKAQGSSRSVYNFFVYKKTMNNDIFNHIILVLYVNDILILAKHQSYVNGCKNQSKCAFNMKDLNKFKSVLGMKIHWNLMKKSLSLSQGKYVQCVFDQS